MTWVAAGIMGAGIVMKKMGSKKKKGSGKTQKKEAPIMNFSRKLKFTHQRLKTDEALGSIGVTEGSTVEQRNTLRKHIKRANK